MTFDFHPEAEAELRKAMDFYEEVRPTLGEELALEVLSAIRSILSHPKAWPVLEADIRRCLVHRFPYGILYSVEPDRIHVLAVMHLHRRPGYWKQRR
jgi:plasmid stabilization system protein ParE